MQLISPSLPSIKWPCMNTTVDCWPIISPTKKTTESPQLITHVQASIAPRWTTWCFLQSSGYTPNATWPARTLGETLAEGYPGGGDSQKSLCLLGCNLRKSQFFIVATRIKYHKMGYVPKFSIASSCTQGTSGIVLGVHNCIVWHHQSIRITPGLQQSQTPMWTIIAWSLAFL